MPIHTHIHALLRDLVCTRTCRKRRAINHSYLYSNFLFWQHLFCRKTILGIIASCQTVMHVCASALGASNRYFSGRSFFIVSRYLQATHPFLRCSRESSTYKHRFRHWSTLFWGISSLGHRRLGTSQAARFQLYSRILDRHSSQQIPGLCCLVKHQMLFDTG